MSYQATWADPFVTWGSLLYSWDGNHVDSEAQIDTAVAMLTAKRQRFWRYTQAIDRDNPFSSGLRSNLTPVPTPAAWNAIFLAAAALDPLTV